WIALAIAAVVLGNAAALGLGVMGAIDRLSLPTMPLATVLAGWMLWYAMSALKARAVVPAGGAHARAWDESLLRRGDAGHEVLRAGVPLCAGVFDLRGRLTPGLVGTGREPRLVHPQRGVAGDGRGGGERLRAEPVFDAAVGHPLAAERRHMRRV